MMNEAIITAYREQSNYYCNLGRYENRYPGSIGFINPTTEIFVIREPFFYRRFRPRFFLYNHQSNCITRYFFLEIDKCPMEVLNFLNTVRFYSIDSKSPALYRTYYDDLISEWEVVNKCLFQRKFMRK